MLNKTAYTELILYQEYTVCFQIVEEEKINPINMETQEDRGRNSQEILSQPHGIPRQYYEINLQGAN